MEQIFIAREEQLKQLGYCLAQAVGGQGRVCFVSGEAGSGKTTLVQEFVRRAQAQDKDLAVAVGLCDAQTGVGDAYLPFREVLGQLTGDVDAKLAQGAITQENAGRLRNMLVLAGQAIVDVGPDLVGVFVPGVGLVTKLGAFVAGKVGWLDKLEKLVNKPKDKPGESGIQESHIFEQYANVLCRIAEKHPLLIILDDLHWADAASINLLFHLGRRIGQHQILILGTYRSAEVAIGRGGERHPLEKVLAEFKRYFGDITIDLDKAVEAEGKQFVEAFLESEPNNLKDTFITNLYHHTGGHPLFTVELLRNMQERGDLIKDEQGRWVESESLNWENLPTRVEGVIEERIGRLEEALKQTLTVGSVQGENFTAEVVARVQQAEAGGLIRKLSGELERQHRLVHAEGIRRLDPGGQRLSLFRFQHNLFRTYLYNELSEAERAYLHEDVGNALEALYGNQADEVAVQLALHFEKAGLDEKARHYLQKAGEQAAARYANEEAIAYFTRALEMTSEADLEKRFELLLLREKVYSIKGNRDLQHADIESLKNLANDLGENQKLVVALLREVSYFLETGNFSASLETAEKCLSISDCTKTPELKAKASHLAGDAAMRLGKYDLARNFFEESLSISRAEGLRQIESTSLRGLGVVAYDQSDYEESMQYNLASLELSRNDGDRMGTSKTLNNLGFLHRAHGEIDKTMQCYEEAIGAFREMGDRRREAIVLGNIGATFAEEGNLSQALTYFQKSYEIGVLTGDVESQTIMLGNMGNLSAQLGDLDAAESYHQKTLELDEQLGSIYHGVIDLNSYGMTLNQKGEYERAAQALEKSIELAKEHGIRKYEASSLIELGTLSRNLGDFQAALNRLEQGAKIHAEIGYKILRTEELNQKAKIYFQLGKYKEGKEICLEAINLLTEYPDKETDADEHLNLGKFELALGNFAQARKVLNHSLEIRKAMKQHFRICELQACLAEVALHEGNLEEAISQIEHTLGFLTDHIPNGTDEPMRIYLSCYQVLQAANDLRAEEILIQAHTLLMERAEKITDDAMRTSYLKNVAANREIAKAFTQRE
jgi:tetratricopeptide (TPR) repeat protein